MKKICFLVCLSLIFFVSGCDDKIIITDTDFDVKSCDRYFELMDCILENDDDKTYTKEMRDELRMKVKSIQEEWNELNEEELDERCTSELSRFYQIEEQLDEIWCPIE